MSKTLSAEGLWLAWTHHHHWQPDPAACSSAMSSIHCRPQPHPLHEVNIECMSGKAQSSSVEGARSPHTKPGGSEKEDALLTSPAAPEPTALQLHSVEAVWSPHTSSNHSCSKEIHLLSPDLVKLFKSSSTRESQEDGHGIFRNPWCQHPARLWGSQPCGALIPAQRLCSACSAPLLGTLRAAQSTQN